MYGKLSFIRLRGQKLTLKSLKINLGAPVPLILWGVWEIIVYSFERPKIDP
nr:MAG TPA: hypothetical protein [Caudoviricetes sp.]